jgi:hypothetical protein
MASMHVHRPRPLRCSERGRGADGYDGHTLTSAVASKGRLRTKTSRRFSARAASELSALDEDDIGISLLLTKLLFIYPEYFEVCSVVETIQCINRKQSQRSIFSDT